MFCIQSIGVLMQGHRGSVSHGRQTWKKEYRCIKQMQEVREAKDVPEWEQDYPDEPDIPLFHIEVMHKIATAKDELPHLPHGQ